MIAGRFVFRGLADWQKIKQLEYDFPEGFDEQAQDLVRRLLVREPDQRLGAGSTGSPYDMRALRSHSFFASINWSTLWSDPPPPLEAGLVKKDAPQSSSISIRLEWDALDDNAIEDDDQDELDDAVSWTSNGEGTEPNHSPTRANGHTPHELIGPYDERRTEVLPPLPLSNMEEERHISIDGVRFISPSHSSSIPEDEMRDTVNDVLDIPVPTRSSPIDVPRAARPGSHSTGSITSSSDGSPVDKLPVPSDESSRGRPRAQTPIQGNGLHDPELYVTSLAFFHAFRIPLSCPLSFDKLTGVAERRNSLMLPEEHVVFNTSVEPGGPKRRASRLLAMAVTPKKHQKQQQQRPRQLILTTHRLLCVKNKPGRALQVRTELFVKSPSGKDKDKERDLRHLISSIEPKGEREFVVITPTKTHCWIAGSASIASTWIRKIQEVIETNPPVPATGTGFVNGASLSSNSAATAFANGLASAIPIGGRLRSISRT
uniref:Acetolactate synthase small subunit n=1 Tax=Ganoderma boninense TaxID=34458 RepID=A0A5K1JYY8_9APHY|nr:Acetolactate synthase small subunit [Ganoderma boninense]